MDSNRFTVWSTLNTTGCSKTSLSDQQQTCCALNVVCFSAGRRATPNFRPPTQSNCALEAVGSLSGLICMLILHLFAKFEHNNSLISQSAAIISFRGWYVHCCTKKHFLQHFPLSGLLVIAAKTSSFSSVFRLSLTCFR